MKVARVLESSLYVEDLEAAERFYTGVLGLQVHSRAAGRHLFLRLDRAMLLLFDPERTSTEQSTVDGSRVPTHGARGPGHLAFAVSADELPAWRARFAEAGVEIESEVTWPSGGTSLYVRDPAGNSIELAPAAIWGSDHASPGSMPLSPLHLKPAFRPAGGELNVIIEAPKGSRNKYGYEPEEGAAIVVIRATDLVPEVEEAVIRLVPHLGPRASPTGRAAMVALVKGPSTRLFLAVDRAADGEPFVGMLTLASYPIPTGIRAWIEDVVVDPLARGRGVGEALVRAALEAAREVGAASVDLTSRPEREAANRLYRRIGFERRETNAYRYHFHR